MYQNILVPVAPDHTHQTSEAIDLAKKMAGDGASITALTVVESIPDYVSQYLPKGQLAKTRSDTRDILATNIADTPDVKIQVVTGHSGRTIVEYAEKHGHDLIVIASHRPGLQDYFLGSTAARVVRHAQCAVHVLR